MVMHLSRSSEFARQLTKPQQLGQKESGRERRQPKAAAKERIDRKGGEGTFTD
jgi:hypothetical protein